MTPVLPPSLRRRRRDPALRPLVAFLLVSCFGILFAGCTQGSSDSDEFTFTAEDAERIENLKAQEDAMNVTGSLALELPEEKEVTLDLSLLSTYNAIRSGPAATGKSLYRVVNTFLNVRSEPSVTGTLVERLEQGDLVELIDFIDAAWAKVKVLPTGPEGFVSQRYISKLVSEDALQEEKDQFEGSRFVDFGFLNVRKTPDVESEKIGELPGQAIVKPISQDDVWARIPFDGKEGFVAVEYLSPFLPNFLVRQERYTLPILTYRVSQDGILDVLPIHLDRLVQSNAHILTFRDFYDLVLSQEERDIRLEPRSVILAITGLSPANVKEVSDILRTTGVTATLFLQTQYVGVDGVTHKTILTLLANGNDIQSAGHTGDDLRSLTNAQVSLELTQSRAILEEVTKRPVYTVAYPRGGVNDRVIQKAQEAGYLFGLGSAADRVFHREQFLRIPGFVVSPTMQGGDVLSIVLGETSTGENL